MHLLIFLLRNVIGLCILVFIALSYRPCYRQNFFLVYSDQRHHKCPPINTVLSTADFTAPVPQFEQFALENYFWECNPTPSVNNITINYTDPATSTYAGNFPKNAQIWTVLACFLLLSTQSLMDLTSCFGQEQEIHWIGDFTFIFSYHNHLNNRLPAGKEKSHSTILTGIIIWVSGT